MQKSNLHKTYYLLAIIDVITIIITLFLAYSIYQIYENSFMENEIWMQRSNKYDQLTDLAINANGPGNDVFDSRNVPLESGRLKEMNGKIKALSSFLVNDANTNLTLYPEIKTRLENFSNYLVKANNYTQQIFKLIGEKNIRDASEIMSKMDGQFHMALLEISKLRNKVRAIQKEQLLIYHEKAKDIFYKEFYVAGFILCLVGLILFFGRRIKNSFEEMYRELQTRNNQLSDSEEMLKSVLNTMLESVIIINDKGLIEYINPESEKLFQYSHDEMKYKNIKEIVPKEIKDKHDGFIKKYLETKEKHVIGAIREVEGLKKDKSLFPLEIGISEVQLEDKLLFVGVLRDISEKKQSEFYLSSITRIQDMYINGESQKKVFDTILKFLLDYTKSEYGFIGVIFKDEEGQPYLKTFAISNISWDEKTKRFYEKKAPEGLEFKNLDSLFGRTLKTGEIVIANDVLNHTYACGLPDGHPKINTYLGMPMYGNDGLIAMYGLANRKGGYTKAIASELSAITTVVTSIIESARSLSLIEKMANRDALTGAYNRFYFKSYIGDMLKRRLKKETDAKFCIMMMDFDKFKFINDYYGHECGDYIIKSFTQRVNDSIKTQDLLARIGGDEFVVLIDGVRDFNDAGRVAKRIVQLSKEPYFYEDKKLECSASIGIACYPVSGNDVDELLRHADLALYRAKNTGSGYCYFSADLQELFIDRQNLEKDIITAFEKKQFHLLLQPKVNIINEKIVGCEALIRWQHPGKGNISPAEFIGIIESMGLSDRLNIYVVNALIQIFEKINPSEPLVVSLNVSPYIHKLSQNIYKIVELLDKSNIDDKISIDFEMTETSFMSNDVNLSQGSEIDKLLSQHKIGLSLDDFGIKYSSINRLAECNFSTIKIDMSFVQKLDTNDAHAAKVIIKAVIDIAKGLDIGIVAEGAETKAQVNALKSLGCKVTQGYYYYKPLTIEEFIKALKISSS